MPDYDVQQTSVYFRYLPNYNKYFLLLTMSFLVGVNSIFSNEEALRQITVEVNYDQHESSELRQVKNISVIEKLEQRSYEGIRNMFPKSTWGLIRVKNFILNISIYLVLAKMTVLISLVQTNIINSLLFGINIALIGFLIKGDGKPSTYKHLKNISIAIKYYSLLVLLMDISLIMIAEGNEKSHPRKGSLEADLYERFPFIYNNLDVVGFKVLVVQYGDEKITQHEIDIESRSQLKIKFYTLVFYYMISLFLVSYFNRKMNEQKDEDDFSEKHFRKLFEFEIEIEKPLLNVFQQPTDFNDKTDGGRAYYESVLKPNKPKDDPNGL